MRTTFLLLTFCVASMAQAQNGNGNENQTVAVRPIEYEMRAGTSLPLGSGIPETDKKFGVCIGGELRYNFKNSPFDAGVMLDITTALYGWKPDEYDRHQSNRTAFLGFTGDYNFRQGGKVNPFAGLGLGLGYHNALVDAIDDTNDDSATAMIVPRVGVELWRHLRFTLAANLSCRYFNNVSLTVGYVIGGGKRR